jgi:hypothetical protein
MKLPLLQPKHPIRRPNPKTRPVYCEATDVIALERGLIAPIKDSERHSIEPNQSTLGCKPEITIRSLRDAMHAALRKPFLGGPRLLAQVPKILRVTRAESAGKQHHAHLQPYKPCAQGDREYMHSPIQHAAPHKVCPQAQRLLP